GILVPVGNYVGKSRWCRADDGGGHQQLANIGVHVALLWLAAIPRQRIAGVTLSGRVSAVNEPEGSPICSPEGRSSAAKPLLILHSCYFATALLSDPMVLRLKCRIGIEPELAVGSVAPTSRAVHPRPRLHRHNLRPGRRSGDLLHQLIAGRLL